ncbi:MAG: putative sulfate exporter family transporter [Acidobacteriaceae bacterium]|nr:putative sulfate exporter family transporter [Acidobacteriaceae bacterium]
MTQTIAETSQARPRVLDVRTVFLLLLMLAGTGMVSPPVALLGGLVFGLVVQEHPMRKESARLSKVLLQASVVLLGFGMNVREVVHAGRSGFAYTAVSISLVLLLGVLFGRLLSVQKRASFLITVGTAICGGSAIAAVAPVLEAKEEEVSVAMGTVFVLNSAALILFPLLGHALHLSQNGFGLWAALAIHDTSSVVGAGAAYGAQALAVGTTVKLARALWIVPVSLITAMVVRRGRTDKAGAKVTIPWFIALFCAAAGLHALLPRWTHLFGTLDSLGKTGLAATLFLIGSSLSQRTLREVGVRPLLQGIALWFVIATASLLAVKFGVISI